MPRFTVPGNEWCENVRTGGYLHHCERVTRGPDRGKLLDAQAVWLPQLERRMSVAV